MYIIRMRNKYYNSYKSRLNTSSLKALYKKQYYHINLNSKYNKSNETQINIIGYIFNACR